MHFVLYAEYHYATCHYVKCHYAKRHYAEFHYAKCHYATCHYAECRYGECPGAPYLTQPPFTNLIKLPSRDYNKAPLEPVGSTAIVLFAKQFANVNTSLYFCNFVGAVINHRPTFHRPTFHRRRHFNSPTQFTDTITDWKAGKGLS